MYADCGRRLLVGLPTQAFIWHSNADFGNCCLGFSYRVNIISLLFFAEYYETTKLTMLLHAILTMPYPYWSVILLSGAGTFLSIRFADELMDIAHHRDRSFLHRRAFKHEIVIFVFFVFVLIGYYKLIASLGIESNL